MKRDEVIIDKHTIDDFFLYSKGIAIITIVLYHLVYFYCDWIPAFIRRTSIIGGNGIFIFFLLSGYGLNYSRIHSGLNGYWKKRLNRVYIPYIVVVLISFFFTCI